MRVQPNGVIYESREAVTDATSGYEYGTFASGWRRISVTFPVTASASGTALNVHFMCDAKAGTVWFSAPQVEKGEIAGLIDSTGATVVEYKYDAWGNPLFIRTKT